MLKEYYIMSSEDFSQANLPCTPFKTGDVIEFTITCNSAAKPTDLVPSFRNNKLSTSNYV